MAYAGYRRARAINAVEISTTKVLALRTPSPRLTKRESNTRAVIVGMSHDKSYPRLGIVTAFRDALKDHPYGINLLRSMRSVRECSGRSPEEIRRAYPAILTVLLPARRLRCVSSRLLTASSSARLTESPRRVRVRRRIARAPGGTLPPGQVLDLGVQAWLSSPSRSGFSGRSSAYKELASAVHRFTTGRLP